MALFVDHPMWPAHGTRWAHLISDVSLAELHAFAAANQLPRRAFDLDHYDVPADALPRLLAAGAREVSARELITRLRGSGLRVTRAQRLAARRAELFDQWMQVMPQAPEVGSELLGRWAESHRRHHGLSHLRAMLFDIHALTGTTNVRREVVLAAWFHDAVWRGSTPQDEHASAELAGALLTPHVSAAEISEVQRLIRLTAGHTDAGHTAASDRAAAVLLDADLAVLGSHPSRYARYTRDIRAEYSHVPDADFRRGRQRVLTALLARPQLYLTARGREWWEERARENLATEREELAFLSS